MRAPLGLGHRLLNLLGWAPRNRRQRRAAERRRSLVRRSRFDTLEQRVVLNADPVAVDDYYDLHVSHSFTSGTVDISSFGPDLGNDYDPDYDSINLQSSSNPGTTSGTAGSSLNYSYSIEDGNGGVGNATVYVNIVADLNENPVAGTDTYTIHVSFGSEGGIIDLSAYAPDTSNDYDADGDGITIDSSDIPTTPTFFYLTGYGSPVSYGYSISDGYGGIAYGSVAFYIVNDPPSTTDDEIIILEGGSAYIPDYALSANDTDDAGVSLSAFLPTTPFYYDTFYVTDPNPLHGTLLVDGGYFTYTPSGEFFGNDAFYYGVSDGNNTSYARVFVTVQPVNDAPSVLVTDVTRAMNAGDVEIEDFGTFSQGPSNENEQELTVVSISNDNPRLFADEGQPEITIDPLTGEATLTFTPQFAGSARVTITVQDDGGTTNGGQNTTTKSFWINITEPAFSGSFGVTPPALDGVRMIRGVTLTTSVGEFDVHEGTTPKMAFGDTVDVEVELADSEASNREIKVYWGDGSSPSTESALGNAVESEHEYDTSGGLGTAVTFGYPVRIEYYEDSVLIEQLFTSIAVAYVKPSLEVTPVSTSYDQGEQFDISGTYEGTDDAWLTIEVLGLDTVSIDMEDGVFTATVVSYVAGVREFTVRIYDSFQSAVETSEVTIDDVGPEVYWGFEEDYEFNYAEYDLFNLSTIYISDVGYDDPYYVVIEWSDSETTGTTRRLGNDGTPLTATAKVKDKTGATIEQRDFSVTTYAAGPAPTGWGEITDYVLDGTADWDNDPETDDPAVRVTGHAKVYVMNPGGESVTVSTTSAISSHLSSGLGISNLSFSSISSDTALLAAYPHVLDDYPHLAGYIEFDFDAWMDFYSFTSSTSYILVSMYDPDTGTPWVNNLDLAPYLVDALPPLSKVDLPTSVTALIVDSLAGEEVTLADSRTVQDSALIRFQRNTTMPYAERGTHLGEVVMNYYIVREGSTITDLASLIAAAADAQADWETDTSGSVTISAYDGFASLSLVAASDSEVEWDEAYEIWFQASGIDALDNTVTTNWIASEADGFGRYGLNGIVISDVGSDVVFGSNNVDTASTGLNREFVTDGASPIALYDGLRAWNVPFAAGIPTLYQGYSQYVLQAFQVPELFSTESAYYAALRSAGVAPESLIAYRGKDMSRELPYIPDTASDGRRTLRRFSGGISDVYEVSRFDPNPSVTGDYGEPWRLDYVDRLIPVGYDGIDYGFLLLRGDGTSAWYKAAPGEGTLIQPSGLIEMNWQTADEDGIRRQLRESVVRRDGADRLEGDRSRPESPLPSLRSAPARPIRSRKPGQRQIAGNVAQLTWSIRNASIDGITDQSRRLPITG
ncbi:MAG: Ig-like domain-containing protein [Pirellulales bacterium]